MLQRTAAWTCGQVCSKQACSCLSRVLWLQCGDEGVALESCEFWSAFCEASVAQPDRLNPEILRPFLGRLVPVLLKNMVSSLARLAGSSSVDGIQVSNAYVPLHTQLACRPAIFPINMRDRQSLKQYTQFGQCGGAKVPVWG